MGGQWVSNGHTDHKASSGLDVAVKDQSTQHPTQWVPWVLMLQWLVPN